MTKDNKTTDKTAFEKLMRQDPEQEFMKMRQESMNKKIDFIDQQASEGAIVEVDMETAIAMGGFPDDAMDLEDALEGRFDWTEEYEEPTPYNPEEDENLSPEETGEDDPRNYPDYDPEIHKTEV